MKKALIGLSAILIAAFVVILAVNAQTSQQGTKKSCTEMAKDSTKCPAATSACKMKCGTASTAKTCDQAKCKEMSCDQAKCKEGKCNHESCKGAAAATSGEAKKCCEAAHKCGSVN